MSEEKLPEMIERVSLAIRQAIGTRHHGLPKGGWDGLMRLAARAAIEAMREPTDAMVDACDINIPTDGEILGIWADMIEAALHE